MSLLSTSSSRESSSHTPAGLPSPLPFEVALAIKIKGRRMSPTHTFIRLDEDEDGLISKKDLQDSLGEVFGMGLSYGQIEALFNRACFFRSTNMRVVESRNDPQASGENGIDFSTFQKYIEHTAMDTSSPTSTMYGSYGIAATVKKNKNGPRKNTRSVFAKTKVLRSLVLRLLEQSATTDGMAATQSFLEIDASRNNHITRGQFMEWLEDGHGVILTEEELSMVLGEWQDEEVLTMTEFTHFVDSLKVNTGKRTSTSPNEQILKDTFIHPQQMNLLDNDKSDNELIWAFLNHFRAIGKTLVQGFHHLDETDSKNLSAAEISKGFKKAGLNVSRERSRDLINGFITRGRLDKPGFVRMMTSVPNTPVSE